ncbi:MAG: hypothetical protein JWP74_519 [Marmoricola sp.]|nr:hypothetical protein [Marmoricola sp.]
MTAEQHTPEQVPQQEQAPLLFDLERMPQAQIRYLGRALSRQAIELLEPDTDWSTRQQILRQAHQGAPYAVYEAFSGALAAYFNADPVARFPFFSRLIWSGRKYEALAAYEAVRGFLGTPVEELAIATLAAVDAELWSLPGWPSEHADEALPAEYRARFDAWSEAMDKDCPTSPGRPAE